MYLFRVSVRFEDNKRVREGWLTLCWSTTIFGREMFHSSTNGSFSYPILTFDVFIRAIFVSTAKYV